MNRNDASVSAASGALTALIIDTFFIGDISLLEASNWGEEWAKKRVIKAAKLMDKKGRVKDNDLYSAIVFLEDKFKIPSDPLENKYGGASHHHLYDFSHHPTPVGWFCCVAGQFSKTAYGTDKMGAFNPVDITGKGLNAIYDDPVSKIWKGTVDWIFHMISDMAGSRGSVLKGTRGTGLPGPLLSLLKEISCNKHIRALVGTAGNTDRDKFSVAIQNLFNGRFLADRTQDGKVIKGTEIPFDLRTEMGLAREISKQMIPVLVNECIVRAFYAVSRFVDELDRVDVSSWDDIKKVDPKIFLPLNNPELNRMLLVSSASFSAVDITAAGIKAAAKNPGNKYGFAKDFLLGINYVGIIRLGAAGLGVAVTPDKLEKFYDDYNALSTKVKDNKVIEALSDVPLGVVPASTMVIKTCKDSISGYLEAKDERIRIQAECEKQIKILTEYRNEIESGVSEYLVDNLTVFDEAFDVMDEAVVNNDSDAFIGANATIQDKLGKDDMQFHSQDEFDELMDSDDDFKL